LTFGRFDRWWRVVLFTCAWLAPVGTSFAQSAPEVPPTQASTGGALPVVIEMKASGLDGASVKAAIERELGVPLRLDATAAQRLEIVVTGRRAHVSYFAPDAEPVTRSVDLPRDRDRAVETIAFLAGNLARDEAAALLAELRPPEKPAEEVPPPPLPPPVVTSEPAPVAPAPTAKAPASTPKPKPKPTALIESDRFAFNLSLFPPITLLRETERRRLNLELGLIYSRVGALRGVGFTMGYLNVLGPAEGVAYAIGWSRTGDMQGVQWAIVSEGHGKLKGVSHGGIVNTRAGDVEGLQTAGVASLSHHVVGVQLGGVVSRTFGQEGATVAGIANLAEGKVEGAQIGGIASLAKGVDGVQVSGIANVGGDVNGVQIGLVNVGGKVNGMQLGLINVSQEIHGGALGLVNVAGNGRVQPIGWVSGGTDLSLNGGVKFVTDYTYVFLGFGAVVTRKRSRTETGAGLHLQLGRAYAEAGVGYSNLSDSESDSDHALRQDFRYEARFGYEVFPSVTPFLGGALAQRLQGEGTGVRGEYFFGLAVF
jgi:hypothetical protein